MRAGRGSLAARSPARGERAGQTPVD
jgi:hypothetical protein